MCACPSGMVRSPDGKTCNKSKYHVIGFSDLADLWVIKIKAYDPLCTLYIEIK